MSAGQLHTPVARAVSDDSGRRTLLQLLCSKLATDFRMTQTIPEHLDSLGYGIVAHVFVAYVLGQEGSDWEESPADKFLEQLTKHLGYTHHDLIGEIHSFMLSHDY